MKPSKDRVAAHRARKAKAGLVRKDVYVHPDDWPMVRELVDELARRRAEQNKTVAPEKSVI